MRNSKALIILLSLLFASGVFAQEEEVPKVFSFSQWKQNQKLVAQNHLARSSNKLVIAKSNEASKDDVEDLEKEVARAQNSVDMSDEYTIEDYFLVYLMSDDLRKEREQAEVFKAAAALLSEDEVLAMMKFWVQSLRPQASKDASIKTSWRPNLNSKAARTP